MVLLEIRPEHPDHAKGRNVRAFAPAVLYYALIFALSSSSRPPVEIDLGFDLADKLLHAVLFSGLGACLAYGLFRISAAPFARRAAVVLPLGAALGALDEIHQLFVPLRSADPFDALADALGVGLGLILFRLAAEPRLRGRG